MSRIGKIFIMTLVLLQPCLPASAQYIVHDPATFAQATLNALRALQSNLNEARQIANQIQQLRNDALNLEQLDISVLDQYSNALLDTISASAEIDGLLQSYFDAEARYRDLYPEYHRQLGAESFDIESFEIHAEQWIDENRKVMIGAAKVGARVLESLPEDQASLDALVTESQGAVGILQATQAGNQLLGQLSAQIMKMTTLMSHSLEVDITNESEETARRAARRKFRKAFAKEVEQPRQMEMRLTH